MRLIDADELKEQLKQLYLKAYEWKGETACTERAEGGIAAYLETALIVIDALTTDAVPVVRCKDCVFCRDEGLSGLYCEHPDERNPIVCLPDDFL